MLLRKTFMTVSVLYCCEKKNIITAVLIKENTWMTYSFRSLIHCRHGGKHGRVQADMGLEKEQRVLHLDLKAGGDCVSN